MPCELRFCSHLKLKLDGFQAQDFAAAGADHALVPGRVPDQFHIGLLDGIKRQKSFLNVARDLAAQMAAGRSEGHFDIGLAVVDGNAVNQAQIDDIEGNFRVKTLTQLFPNQTLQPTRLFSGWGESNFLWFRGILHKLSCNLIYTNLSRKVFAIFINA